MFCGLVCNELLDALSVDRELKTYSATKLLLLVYDDDLDLHGSLQMFAE